MLNKYLFMWTPLDDFIADALLRKIKEKGITYTELSLRVNRNSHFISNALRRTDDNDQKLNLYQLNSIARALDCSLTEFLPVPYLDYDEVKYNWRLNKD